MCDERLEAAEKGKEEAAFRRLDETGAPEMLPQPRRAEITNRSFSACDFVRLCTDE